MEVPPNHLKSDHWNRLKHLEINGDLGIPFKNLSVYGRTPGTQPVNSLGPRHWSVSSWPCRAQSQPEKLRHCSDPSRLGNHVTHRLYMYTIIPYYTHSYHKVIDIRTIICIYIILYCIILYYIYMYVFSIYVCLFLKSLECPLENHRGHGQHCTASEPWRETTRNQRGKKSWCNVFFIMWIMLPCYKSILKHIFIYIYIYITYYIYYILYIYICIYIYYIYVTMCVCDCVCVEYHDISYHITTTPWNGSVPSTVQKRMFLENEKATPVLLPTDPNEPRRITTFGLAGHQSRCHLIGLIVADSTEAPTIFLALAKWAYRVPTNAAGTL